MPLHAAGLRDPLSPRRRAGGILPDHHTYRKWETLLEVTVLLMQVTEAAARWPESGVRQRRWADLPEARRLLERDALRELLERAAERIEALPDEPPPT